MGGGRPREAPGARVPEPRRPPARGSSAGDDERPDRVAKDEQHEHSSCHEHQRSNRLTHPRSVLVSERCNPSHRGVPHRVGSMTEEQEIKIPVAADFVLPDLDAVVPGTRAVDRGLLELSATYWDTDQLTLLGAQ